MRIVRPAGFDVVSVRQTSVQHGVAKDDIQSVTAKEGTVMPRVLTAIAVPVLLSWLSVAQAQIGNSCGCGWPGYMPTQWTQGIPPGFTPTAWGPGLPWGYTQTSWAPGHFAAPCGCGLGPGMVVPEPATVSPLAPAPQPARELMPLPRPVDPR